MKQYILSLDQGTTSSRAVLFDHQQRIVGIAQREFSQIYPHEGWVEHDAMEIYSSQTEMIDEVLARTGVSANEIAAIGIANQRETTVLWDRHTGRPIYNAIVWQCRRTADICESLRSGGYAPSIQKKTGLVLDAYFSATKIKWILDHVKGARERASNGDILFGTIDSWLIWKLTDGQVHITDHSNASRTMLFNIETLQWDEELCKMLDIPMAMLPEVRSSSEVYGSYTLHGVDIPLAGAAGDQQAALFGQTCFDRGDVKNTYGTGCFLLIHTGDQLHRSESGLVTTLTASTDGKPSYAIEGSIFVAGAVIQWLRDELHILEDAADSEYFAAKVKDTGGVYLVPAFTGLGAPHWDMYARGTLVGLTRGTKRTHIIRAALESIAYQTLDVIKAVEKDTGIHLSTLRVDGGASRNGFLMQFQSDILGATVIRPQVSETTALGAACLAGLAVGFWRDKADIKAMWQPDAVYRPNMSDAQRNRLIAGWDRAVGRSLGWSLPNSGE